MSSRRPARGSENASDVPRDRFRVFVEGPSDRDLLGAWARRHSPRLSRALVESTVILGGRQPARAAQQLRELRLREPEARGLCVLDGDHAALPEPDAEPGLAFFTWSRRHIESYLLVPEAIRRSLRLRNSDGRVARALREHLPEGEEALGRIDAKRLLDRNGPLARALPRAPAPGRIARAMLGEEFHPEIHRLLDEIALGLGLEARRAVVELRPGPASTSTDERGILS